jgi:hypothetical protein
VCANAVLAGQAVAFARSRLETGPIDDRDAPARVLYQASRLHVLRQQRDGGAPHARHLREEFLGQRHDAAVDAIRALQQLISRQTTGDIKIGNSCRLWNGVTALCATRAFVSPGNPSMRPIGEIVLLLAI